MWLGPNSIPGFMAQGRNEHVQWDDLAHENEKDLQMALGEFFPGISQGFPVLPQKSHSMDCLLSEMALLRKTFGVK